MLSIDNVSLGVSDSALREMARRAKEHSTGARALKNIVGGVLKDVMFTYPSNLNVDRIEVDFKDKEFKIKSLDTYEDNILDADESVIL